MNNTDILMIIIMIVLAIIILTPILIIILSTWLKYELQRSTIKKAIIDAQRQIKGIGYIEKPAEFHKKKNICKEQETDTLNRYDLSIVVIIKFLLAIAYTIIAAICLPTLLCLGIIIAQAIFGFNLL